MFCLSSAGLTHQPKFTSSECIPYLQHTEKAHAMIQRTSQVKLCDSDFVKYVRKYLQLHVLIHGCVVEICERDYLGQHKCEHVDPGLTDIFHKLAAVVLRYKMI